MPFSHPTCNLFKLLDKLSMIPIICCNYLLRRHAKIGVRYDMLLFMITRRMLICSNAIVSCHFEWVEVLCVSIFILLSNFLSLLILLTLSPTSSPHHRHPHHHQHHHTPCLNWSRIAPHRVPTCSVTGVVSSRNRFR